VRPGEESHGRQSRGVLTLLSQQRLLEKEKKYNRANKKEKGEKQIRKCIECKLQTL